MLNHLAEWAFLVGIKTVNRTPIGFSYLGV